MFHQIFFNVKITRLAHCLQNLFLKSCRKHQTKQICYATEHEAIAAAAAAQSHLPEKINLLRVALEVTPKIF